MENELFNHAIAFDVVELPSRGIYYKNHKKSLQVSYLNASDEDVLSSPNLIRSSKFIDIILRRKIKDTDITIEELVEEDRQAVLLFLRNTAFGSEYKMTVTDPKTDKDFECTVDLGVVKIRDFNLEMDENGEFDYYLKETKKPIKFKFLSKLEMKEIEEMKEKWDKNEVPPVVTKQLEKMIKSVDGQRDQMAIYQFIQRMPIKDSQEFRKFVRENKPSLDLVQTVKTPSGEEVRVNIGFGVEFFLPFFGI